jgi:hypothetical protein
MTTPSPDVKRPGAGDALKVSWYVLPATIAGNTATVSITDGGLGDDDLAVNGAIVDPGGPAFDPPRRFPRSRSGCWSFLA